MNTIYLIITLSVSTSVIIYVLLRRKHNIKNLIASTIILVILYAIIIDLIHRLTLADIHNLELVKEQIKELGIIVNLILLSYSLIMTIINILLSPIIAVSTTLTGSLYMIYSSIFSKVLPSLELSLSILSNISQLAILVITSIIDIVIISIILLKISKIIIPTILIDRVRIIPIIIIITTIILSLTSVMLLKSINIKTIKHDKTLDLFRESLKEYNNIVKRNYTLITIETEYPSLTTIKATCKKDNITLTIIGIGNFRNIIPCKTFKLKISSIFFDIKTQEYVCSNKSKDNITIMNCRIIFTKNFNLLKAYDRYYIGYYITNCSNIIVNIYSDRIYIINPSSSNCLVDLYLPDDVISDQQLANIYRVKIRKILEFLKIYNNKTFLNNVKLFYKSIGDISYYFHNILVLRNYSSTSILIDSHRFVEWPMNLSYVSYNEWLYENFIRLTNFSKNIISLPISNFLQDEFNKIIISFIYSILLDTLGLTVLFCVVVNLSTVENVFYKIFIRISKSVLYDFVLILYFRIISNVIARRVIRRLTSIIRSKRSIIFVDRYDSKIHHKVIDFSRRVRMFYGRRYRGYDMVFRKCRDIVYRKVDSRIVREIDSSRVPVFDLKIRRTRKFNIVVEDVIRSLYGKSLSELKLGSIKGDRRLLFLVSAVYKSYDNIIDLSLDVRLVPLHVLVLALRRDILYEICKYSDAFSTRLRRILSEVNDRRFMEEMFKVYVKDLYHVSLLLSSKIDRRVSARFLIDIGRIYNDVDRLFIFRFVKNVVDYYVDRRFVSELLRRYVHVLSERYRDDRSVMRRELAKVRYIRRLFRL
ncbi:MAG: hypothetical protein GXO10_05860 [Crenarchaeota archaeon]|nr:hypothetical protein [Thermoproteota archaeon]